MAESSSDSDHFRYRNRFSRWATRTVQRETGSHPTVDVTAKVNTITSTLQDTSRNLQQVDEMLGRYRDYNIGHAGAIEQLKGDLEQSISQLRSQRLQRNLGGRSASVTSLSASDLDGGIVAESLRFIPTSPLKDYEPQGIKRNRSRTGVRFVRETDDMAQLHAFHQSLRDLSSEQVRLGDDFNKEISRRSRSDAETKRVLEELTEKLNEAQKQDVVSDRVEQRLQEIEREMRTERELVERRQDQLGLMSLKLQEALKKQEAKADENEDVMKNKLRQTETEKSHLEQELELSRRLLNQSEGSRETLLHQVEELRTQLTKAEGDRKGLQHQVAKQQPSSQDDQRDDWRFRRGVEREKQSLERQMAELRVHLNFNAMASELEEVKRCMERKDKEKASLVAQVETLTRDLENREKQQLQMLDQLKEIQNHFETCEADRKHNDLQISELTRHAEDATKQAEHYLSEFQRSEALREEAEKRREDLKTKAQDSIRQWKVKHKKLERALEKQAETLDQLTEKNNQLLKEKDELKSQFYGALQQIENLRKELNDVLTKRALQEEELHCKDQKLSDVQSHQVELELEVKNSLDTIHRLESELKRQSTMQSQIKAEKIHLEEEIAELKMSQAQDKIKLLEMQESIKDLSAIRADLANKLAEEERAKKAVFKDLSELMAQTKSKEEEMATIITQLNLERDVHQRELEDLTSSLHSVKTKHEQNIQELMKHFKKEKSEAENHIRTLKAESLEDKNMAKAHRCQLEKLTSQCEKLTEELAQNENENRKLKQKYQCLKEELEEKEKHISNEEEHLRRMEEARLQLKDQLLCLETEQESILGVIGREIDAACQTFSKDSVEKLKVFTSGPELHYDPHRWLAESKTKLQWLCEELKERESREKNMRQQLMLCRQELRDLTEHKESELLCLFEHIERQGQLLEEFHQEKRGLLEETQRKEEEVETLQDRVNALETYHAVESYRPFPRGPLEPKSTRVALDHLESVPEKLSLLEDFKDFRDSSSLSEKTDGRYSKYRIHRDSLQQRRDDTKYRIKSFKDDRPFAEGSHSHGLDHSSSWQDRSFFLSSPRYSHFNSLPAFTKRTIAQDPASIKEDATSLPVNGTNPQSKKEEYESRKYKI
ncbi:centrosomal protein of 128 kDa isoform X3 [Peromyscus maniculatus bairdii]|uniref:centrosomal protein of 128 kDa isoform X3 n=1 Tax=Peromyscus maniculatus bairdii TaxID=230844 RepID=UPI001C2EEA57|nr:centrosomal protein of 128 kDa isoform X3 [Peromyscus maniculatus bairdii]